MVNTVSNTDKWLTPVWKGFKDVTRFCWDPEQNSIFSENLRDMVKGKADPITKKRPGGDGFKNIGSNSKKAWEASKDAVKGKSFFGSMWESLKSLPKAVSEEVGAAVGIGAKIKAFGGVLAKRMPLIGNLATVAFEIPNVYKAFKEGGFSSGIIELGKSALKVSAFAVGAAVGTAFGGFIGSMALGMAAQWLVEKTITGKSFTENKEEAEEAAKAKTLETQTNATVKETVKDAAQDPKKLTSDVTAKNDATAYKDTSFTGAMNYSSMPDFSKITDLDSLMASGYMKNGYKGVNSQSGSDLTNLTGFNSNFNYQNIFNNQAGLYGKNAFQY